MAFQVLTFSVSNDERNSFKTCFCCQYLIITQIELQRVSYDYLKFLLRLRVNFLWR